MDGERRSDAIRQRIGENIILSFSVLLVVLSALVSISGITEIAGRATVRSVVEAAIGELNSKIAANITPALLVTDTIQVSNDKLIAAGPSDAAFAAVSAAWSALQDNIKATEEKRDESRDQHAAFAKQIEIYEIVLMRLSILESVGDASGGSTLSKLQERIAETRLFESERAAAKYAESIQRRAYDARLEAVIMYYEAFGDSAEPAIASTSVAPSTKLPETKSLTSASWYSSLVTWPATLKSDMVLAIVLIGAGVLGAVSGGLRKSFSLERDVIISPKAFAKDTVLGASAGFITFLVLKGGKFMFVMETAGTVVATNPYGSAFAAVLAGLFTERAYQFLSILLDGIMEKFQPNGGQPQETSTN